MELALSLGDAPTPFSFFEKSQKIVGKDLGLWMAVDDSIKASEDGGIKKPADPPLQLDLLPFSPLHTTNPPSNNFPINWIHKNLGAEPGKKRRFGEEGDEEEGPSLSSPIAVSSFQVDFSIFGWNGIHSDQIINHEQEADRGGSDEEENGSLGRKKLRLSKQQSAFLEQSFKEHSTLNPKQKLALSKQLNLRPRQVEVWFQNRRARTKLKQTEVDCEYLKKCCETLSEENRRLQKELQELRALKAASQPFYMQLPATTLSMCPSCQKVTDFSSNVSNAHRPQPSS